MEGQCGGRRLQVFMLESNDGPQAIAVDQFKTTFFGFLFSGVPFKLVKVVALNSKEISTNVNKNKIENSLKSTTYINDRNCHIGQIVDCVENFVSPVNGPFIYQIKTLAVLS